MITTIRKMINMACALVLTLGSAHAQEHYDIVVYGGTSAGVTASIQAARMGKKVALICQDKHIGGLTSSGLGATDINRREVIGGIAREFYARVYDHYSAPEAWTRTTPENFFEHEINKYYGNNKIKRFWGGKDEALKIMWVFEPHVAQRIFRDMLLEAGVKVIYNERLDLDGNVTKKGNAIRSIRMESGRVISGLVFIDATYEGDLMAKTNVSYFVGREPNATYGEQWNGILPNEIVGKGDQSISPFVIEGDPESGLLPFIEPRPLGSKGAGDKRIQAYTYRFTLSNDKQNSRPIEKPANYNPLWFEHYARVFSLDPCVDVADVITITPLPNKKTDINHCDFIGANYDWPEGDYATRSRVAQMHKDYALGKVWFLQNDPRVPEHIRIKVREYGLPLDEFQDNKNFPYQIYVREARRMISDYVMTEHDVTGKRRAEDPVALGSYWFDSHVVSHFVDEKNQVWREGTFWRKDHVYPISYRSIVPRKTECTNLLVPVCLASSHAAYGSIRMEPVYMVLGQSAATAASLSIDQKKAVQDLTYEKLREVLLKDNQILKFN